MMITGRFGVFCVILFFPFLSFAANNIPNHPQSVQLVITQEKGLEYQLLARQVSLKQVFFEIKQATGVTIHYSVLPKDLVSATCVGSTVQQILECLLGSNANLVTRYSEDIEQKSSSNQPVDIWLLGSSIVMQRSDVGSCDKKGNQIREVSNSSIIKDATARLSQIIEQSGATDPKKRSQAIADLAHIKTVGNSEINKIRHILEQTLTDDKDARVRAQAISVLMRRDGESAHSELQQALLDNDASVRLMALEYVEDDIPLLEQALNDSDQNVRYLAEMKLQALNAE